MRKKAIHLIHLMGVVLILSASQLFVACSNEEEATPSNEILLNGKKLTIRIGEDGFKAGAEIRASAHRTDTTIDMGNGIVAEMSIVPNRNNPKVIGTDTRSTTLSDGHYTIYVVDAAGNRLTGADKELSGTVTGGNFVPDHQVSIRLANGTYTFVCHNNAVVEQGGQLKINSSSMSTTCPMIGTVTKTIGGGMNDIAFTLKHYAARIRPLIVTYTSYANMDGNSTTLSSASNGLSDITLSVKGDNPQRATTGSMVYSEASAKQFANVGSQAFSGIVTPFNTEGNYTYIALAPGEKIAVNDLKYNFNGKIYGNPVSHTFLNKTQLDPNYSYDIKLTFTSKTPLLLFQDGTVGYVGDKTPARVPVGVVTKEKTTAAEGTAMALKNAGDAMQYIAIAGDYRLPYSDLNEDKLFETEADGLHYTYTYEHNNSLEDYIVSAGGQYPPSVPVSEYKESGNYVYPAFHMAANYAPGVPTQNIGKWFLPTGSQWREALVKILKLPKSSFEGLSTDNFSLADKQYNSETIGNDGTLYGFKIAIPWSLTDAQTVFTSVGGIFPIGLYNVAGGFTKLGNRVHYLDVQSTFIVPMWTQQADLYSDAHVRPFVHF